MQILLTQEEYDSLAPKQVVSDYKAATARLREMLVGDDCIHHPNYKGFGYCDKCPIGNLDETRGGEKNRRSRLMCDLNREYSK